MDSQVGVTPQSIDTLPPTWPLVIRRSEIAAPPAFVTGPDWTPLRSRDGERITTPQGRTCYHSKL
ncbi:MAG: hypothetical protein ACF8PN_08295 [Phycisphaerales bacterium]